MFGGKGGIGGKDLFVENYKMVVQSLQHSLHVVSRSLHEQKELNILGGQVSRLETVRD